MFAVFLPYHIRHIGQQDIEIRIVQFLCEMVVPVGQGVDHVIDILAQHFDIVGIHCMTSDSVVDPETEIRRKRIPVAENILHNGLVRSGYHRMESLPVFYLIDVRPCRQIDICSRSELEPFSIDYQSDRTLENDDHKVILRPPRLLVHNVVFSHDLACEDIAVDVAHTGDALLPEENGRLD